jgi:hypothetical protein
MESFAAEGLRCLSKNFPVDDLADGTGQRMRRGDRSWTGLARFGEVSGYPCHLITPHQEAIP